MPEFHRPGFAAFKAAPFTCVIAILNFASAGLAPTRAIVFVNLVRAPTSL